jgi:replication factor A1
LTKLLFEKTENFDYEQDNKDTCPHKKAQATEQHQHIQIWFREGQFPFRTSKEEHASFTGPAYRKSERFTMGYQEREPIEATVAELKPRMKNITITFKVVEIGEEREVTSRGDGSTHRVADATVGDSTGIVQVPLWDDAIDSITAGNTYLLKNGYTGLFRSNLRLNVGKYGELSDAEEAIEEVNMEVDMSAEEHEDTRRRRYGGGGYGGRDRRGGGGYGGGGGGGYDSRDRRGGGGYGGRDRRRRY